jgi:signal transduction histidine kinase
LYEQEAKRKGIRFDALTRENETVMADKNMVGIVLQNLINNAVKFTEAGGIVKINAEKNNTSGVTISVADTGRGMGRDKIARLINGNGFTTEGTGQEKGVGLGFQICKEFIHLNNGKLDIQSEENEGTVVMITLPRQ